MIQAAILRTLGPGCISQLFCTHTGFAVGVESLDWLEYPSHSFTSAMKVQKQQYQKQVLFLSKAP